MRRVTKARLVVSLAFIAASIGPARGQDSVSETRRKVAELEAKVAGLPPGTFDFGLHNELRHLYGGLDERKSMIQCDIIFRNSFLDDYMFQVLGGKDPDPGKAVQALTAVARRYPDLPNLAAACWIRGGPGDGDRPRHGTEYYRRAGQIRDATTRYREAAQDRLILPTGPRTPWPSRIPAPAGGRRSPGPWNDPADTTVWPNQRSRANSDPWLAEHHDQIKRMRPRVLLVNFSNEHTAEHLMGLVNQIIQCLAEASRYHGHADPKVPAFLQYQIFKLVDLRDPDSTRGDSHLVPLKPRTPDGSDVKYREFFTDHFARAWRVPDPRPGAKGRFLRLDELVDGGYVHEVWFFTSGAEDPERRIRALEVVEMKPRYDEAFRKQGDQFVQAGNGGDADQPWTGRSVRIGCINASRGPGCFLESLSHGIEGTANSGAIPYFTRYFHEYAGFDLKARYGLPFDSLYGADFGQTADPLPGRANHDRDPPGQGIPGRGLHPGRWQRALPTQRPKPLRPGQSRAGPLDHRGLADRPRTGRPRSRAAVLQRRSAPQPRPCARLHGRLAGLLAAEHAGLEQSPERRRRAAR